MRKALTTVAGTFKRRLDIAVLVALPLLCGYLGANAGRDLNWDQLNYHLYVAHAFVHDRLGLDFNAASVQSYVNPLAHLPFYAAATSSLGSWTASFLLGSVHGLALSFLYVAGRLTTSAMPRYTHLMSLAVVVIALSHPVFLAELGSSLSEVVALVPMMAALCGLCLARRTADARRQLWWTALGFGLAGVAVILKLAFVVFAPGLFAFALLGRPTWRARSVGLAVAALALMVGCYVGGGFWHVRVAHEFGNPFFPFFNNIFRSPDYPAVALENHRFIGHGLLDLLLLPWRMLSLSAFVTTERVVVDPRYIIVCALLMAALGVTISRRSWPRGDVALLGFFGIGYVLWVFSSGNGRYALPLHLSCGLVAAQLCMHVWPERGRAAAAVAAIAGTCVACALVFGGLAQWTRVEHGPRWYELHVPRSAAAADGLYLSVGYFNRSSWSFLVPWLPATARFVNVNGYANPPPDGPGGRRIAAMIAAHHGALRVITEGSFPANDAAAARYWLDGINRNLEGFGVRLANPAACAVVWMRSGDKAAQSPLGSPVASVCPLERVPALDHRREKLAVDAAFDALERELPTLLYPARQASYFRGDGYCRFYVPLEYYLCEARGDLRVFRINPDETLLRRPVARR